MPDQRRSTRRDSLPLNQQLRALTRVFGTHTLQVGAQQCCPIMMTLWSRSTSIQRNPAASLRPVPDRCIQGRAQGGADAVQR